MARILVTNDDGIFTTGIAKLARAMEPLGEVFVVAPDTEMSSISHALSILQPLRYKEIRERWIAVAGTPTDCVYLAIKALIPKEIDLVVSGINKGANLGEDVHYSGTVAGAVEGCILGKPAIAFSQIGGDEEALDRAAGFAREMAAEVLLQEYGQPLLLNVNFPPEKSIGVRLTRLGTRHYEDTIREDIDEKGNPFIVIAGTAVHREQDKDTDCQVIEEGCISVTPLQLDLSDFEAVVRMSSWKFFSDKR